MTYGWVMTARSLWKGTLSFGLVEIPISLFSAERTEDEISFTLLDERDLSPVGYERVNKATGEKVPWEKIVRGYEYEKGEYAVLTDEEIQSANVGASQTIEIVEFVDAADIEPLYYVKPYYVAPAKKESRAYALLRETLKETGKVGIAQVVIRARQHLAAVGVRGPAIVVNLLRYSYEVRDVGDLELPGAKEISDKEVKAAEQLVETMSGEWDPAKYRDRYRDDVLKLVERKVKEGKTTTPLVEEAPKAKKKDGEVLDLMPLLKQSLIRSHRAASAEPKRAARKTVRRRATGAS